MRRDFFPAQETADVAASEMHVPKSKAGIRAGTLHAPARARKPP